MIRTRGFAIVSAIFILIVLSVLGAFILTISSGQQLGSALDVQGARAYQAARAGIEWGLFSQLRNGTCAATTNFVPPAVTLTGFTVTVQCVAVADASGGPTVYQVTSTACSEPLAGACPNTTNPSQLYVERRLTVVF